ncbi:MAG: hypothetical protein AAGC76_09695 [Luteibacter sp.]|uniref:hypothetical protein n=1 Tax=Luteibacter sp. TaxID=1886636 RepID=UPI0028069522|nr:hypothetical protein [Luteibacter sp.]MDQ7996114.1 hypothetical protein [Luteibacter sp.]
MLDDFRIKTQATRDKQSDKIASMLRQAADDAEDAERYRAIRDGQLASMADVPKQGFVYACRYVHVPGNFPCTEGLRGTELDAAIDAARNPTKEG